MQTMPITEVDALNLLSSVEEILGPKVMAALLDALEYKYFGSDNVFKIIQSKPYLFKRAMEELLGDGGLAILRISDTERLLALR